MAITLITGVPGSGKTAHVVELLLEELKKKRRVYSIGIPDLVAQHKVPDDSKEDGFCYFAVEDAGNPRTWQKGSWLQIQTYKPIDGNDEEFEPDNPDDIGKSNWQDNDNKRDDGSYLDNGALVIIDEAQTYFRPRSSASKVPDYIAAFEVHRHQGLDFWILTQRPALLDGNLRGLVSKHIHIHTSSMGKKKLEWAECQNPDNRASRMTANRTSYKPNPKVFDLYKSAQVHTVTKIKLPNGVYMLGFCFVAMVLAVFFLYQSFHSRFSTSDEISSNSSLIQSAEAQPVQTQSFHAQPVQTQSFHAQSVQTQPIRSQSVQEKRLFFVSGFARNKNHYVYFLNDTVSGSNYRLVLTNSFYQSNLLKVGSYFKLSEDSNIQFLPSKKFDYNHRYVSNNST